MAVSPSTAIKKNTPSLHRKPLNLRAQVVRVLVAVLQGQSLNTILPNAIRHINERDIGLFHELVMGTLRYWYALDKPIKSMLDRPLTDNRVHAAVLLGLYQILKTRIPHHAAISETVDAVKQLGQDKASGLVNALLRRSLRELESIGTLVEKSSGLPIWLEKILMDDWGSERVSITTTLKQAAPLTLRVNEKVCSRSAYLKILAELDIPARATAFSDAGIVLDGFATVTKLPLFNEGGFSVQDEHAQLCATLLGNINGQCILDACAAPGGKTAHLLECYHPSKLIALDIDAKRLQRVTENLSRLQLLNDSIEIVAASATTWRATTSVDVILLDAPCTATGVMRRHPDIRLLRQLDDVAQTVALQASILDHLWTQLAVGGTLLYVTCSILKDENERQVQAFLARTPNAVELPIQASWGIAQSVGRQCLPVEGGGDGFYFARLTKR